MKEAVEIFTNEPESADEIVSQISSSGQTRNIRVVDLYAVIRAVVIAAAERREREATTKQGAIVSQYQAADPNMHGIIVESIDDATIGLAIVEYGKGRRLRLNAAEARLLGEKLISMALEHDASTPKDLN